MRHEAPASSAAVSRLGHRRSPLRPDQEGGLVREVIHRISLGPTWLFKANAPQFNAFIHSWGRSGDGCWAASTPSAEAHLASRSLWSRHGDVAALPKEMAVG